MKGVGGRAVVDGLEGDFVIRRDDWTCMKGRIVGAKCDERVMRFRERR